jgi:hypothetical protein
MSINGGDLANLMVAQKMLADRGISPDQEGY